MLKLVWFQRAAALALALGLLPFSTFGQRIARSRSSEAALAVEARFFPLAEGNSWTYQVAGLGPEDGVTVEVGAPRAIGGISYFPVTGYFGGESLLRLDARGRLLEYKSQEGREALWYDFATPMGGTWTPEFPGGCDGPATVKERNAAAIVPAGDFPETVHIGYGPSPCADAGLTDEIFSSGVGLISRTETTIAGPRSMRLVRARVQGRTIEGAGLSFSVKIDKPVYTPNLMPPIEPDQAVPELEVTATVENTSEIPLKLTFPSTQLFDLRILNSAGESVYVWSATRLFAAVVTEVELGRLVFEESIPLGAGREPLPPGMYVLEAWLVRPEGKVYSGTVGFEITEPAH